jgi:Bacterial Ig-like domain
MRSISRARGALALLVPFALAAACDDPELASELDSDGPPELLEVNVASESAPEDPNANAIEAATWCRPGEEFKVSTFYCPLARDGEGVPIPGQRELEGPITDATPIGWHVSFIFSELLDPDIETLNEDGSGSLADSQPFVLRCNDADLTWTGWYDPTGSYQSYPPGPRLVALPDDFIPTGSSCEVSLRDGVVRDKDEEVLPNDPLGPFEFTVAAMAVSESIPEDESEGVTLDTAIEVAFNAPVDESTLDDRIVVEANDAPVAGQLTIKEDEETGEPLPNIVVFTPDGGLTAETTYTISVVDGVADIGGGLLAQEEPFVATFTTGEAE